MPGRSGAVITIKKDILLAAVVILVILLFILADNTVI